MKRTPHERVVCALFDSKEEAHRALDRLSETEIPSEDISVIANMRDYEEEEFSEVVGMKIHDESLHAAKWGAFLGSGLAAITGTFGMWMGQAPVLGAMPLIGVLTAFGAILGSVLATGFQENEAVWMDEAMQEGKVMLALHSNNRREANHAEAILRDCHAQAVHHY